MFTLASCSQDDEYYEDGLFTRADEMMTRSGGDPGGNEEEVSYVEYYYLNPVTEPCFINAFLDLLITASCSIKIPQLATPEVSAQFSDYHPDNILNPQMNIKSEINGDRIIVEYTVICFVNKNNVFVKDSVTRSCTFNLKRIQYPANEMNIEQPKD